MNDGWWWYGSIGSIGNKGFDNHQTLGRHSIHRPRGYAAGIGWVLIGS